MGKTKNIFTLIELLVNSVISCMRFFIRCDQRELQNTPFFFKREGGAGEEKTFFFRKKESFLCPRTYHFTLIELLVVIAIIAILAAMLLPALQSARERGRIAACLANQKELSLAIQMYSDNSDDFLPPAKYNKDGFNRWHYLISRFLNSGKSTSTEMKTFSEYFRCPSFNGYKLSENFPVIEQHITYGMNNATGDNNALPATSFIKRVRVYSPSKRPLIADNYRLNYDTNLNNASQTAWNWYSLSADDAPKVVAHQMHRKMPNVGFVDGHVSGPEPTNKVRWPKKLVQFHVYDKW